MDMSEAMQALTEAGQAKAVEGVLAREGGAAARVYEDIRSDHTRTEEAKRWMLANAYMGRRTRVEQELSTMASRIVRNDRDDAERVIGTKGLAGDAASLVISRRDAADRVAGVTDVDELRTLLRRATRSGDEVLARAIAEKALENGDGTTMQQFIADRPDLDSAAERLWNAQQARERSFGQSFGLSMNLSGLRPHELSGLYAGDIEDLVKAEPGMQRAR